MHYVLICFNVIPYRDLCILAPLLMIDLQTSHIYTYYDDNPLAASQQTALFDSHVLHFNAILLYSLYSTAKVLAGKSVYIIHIPVYQLLFSDLST